MEKADRVDVACNRLHVACLTVLKLEKLPAYRDDSYFCETAARFRTLGDNLMAQIRGKEK
jgi:hypothetical protein